MTEPKIGWFNHFMDFVRQCKHKYKTKARCGG